MTRKEAYEIGVNLALRNTGLLKESASLGRFAGAGALGGGVLGGVMGGDLESVAKGALAGGAAGAGAHQLPKLLNKPLGLDKDLLKAIISGDRDEVRALQALMGAVSVGGGVAGGLGGLGAGALIS